MLLRLAITAVKMFSMHLIRINLFLMILTLCSCASAPTNVNDGCSLLSENVRWYDHANETKSKWGVSIGTQLAFIRQESGFDENAQPPRTTIFWFIPWTRLSSAYGYAQVLDGTWDWYKKDTGNVDADRDEFADSSDFIGWYITTNSNKLGISKTDDVSQYLAYHEGHNGFIAKSYLKKSGLMATAKKVARNSKLYSKQIIACESDLQRQSWWWLF